MKRAVGYVRCSTDEQGATSIPQQKLEIEQWAEKNEYAMIRWFVDEGKSGTSFERRPAFKELIRVVESRPDFDYIIAYDESRWGRALNPRESNYWKMHFEKRTVKVRMVHSSSNNGDDIGSYVVEVVESAEASEYSKKLSRAIRRGMLSHQQGKYSRGGTAPYGYKRIAIDLQTGDRREMRDGLRSVPKQEKVVWEFGPQAEVAIVRRIFQLKADGRGFVSIADTLNGEHIPCPKRCRWRNLDQKWSGSTVRTIVENPVYVGTRVYNRRSYSKFVARERGVESPTTREKPKINNSESEWITVPDAHPAIITKELFQSANRNGEHHIIRPNTQYYRSTYLLTGLMKCTHCSFNFQGHTHKKTGRRYYVDGGFVNKGKSICGWYSIRQEDIESFVIDSIRGVLIQPAMRESIEKELDELCKRKDFGADEKELREGRTKTIRQKIQNLLTLAETGMHLECVAERLKALEDELRDLESKQPDSHKCAERRLPSNAEIKEAVRAFLDDFESDFGKAALPERKELVRKVIDKILVDREEGSVTVYVRRLPLVAPVEEINKANGGKDLVEPVALKRTFSTQYKRSRPTRPNFRNTANVLQLTPATPV